MPPGCRAGYGLDETLLSRGLVTADQLQPKADDNQDRFGERPPRILTFAEKLRLLFQSEFPEVNDIRVSPVWCVGELLRFNGDFNKYVQARDLTKQEGVVFRHCLRMILLCGEFARMSPRTGDVNDWKDSLLSLARALEHSCREVDPQSTDKAIESATAIVQTVQDEVPRQTS